jgi:hypothetical protein
LLLTLAPAHAFEMWHRVEIGHGVTVEMPGASTIRTQESTGRPFRFVETTTGLYAGFAEKVPRGVRPDQALLNEYLMKMLDVHWHYSEYREDGASQMLSASFDAYSEFTGVRIVIAQDRIVSLIYVGEQAGIERRGGFSARFFNSVAFR